MNKNKGPMAFILVLVIIGFLSYVALKGLTVGTYTIPKADKAIRYGMDLQGGLRVTYQASPQKKGKKVTDEELNKTADIISARLASRSYFDNTVTVDSARKRITAEIPSVKNPDSLMQILGKPSNLEFRAPDQKTVVLNGSDVKSASTDINQQDGSNEVTLELNADGTKKFADATSKYINKIIYIYVDGKMIGSPKVDAVIADGKAIISPMKDAKEAKDLASNIQSGAIPVNLKIVQSSVVSSILGADAKNTTLFAGAIAMIVILVFMVIVYRLPGLIADIALIFYTLIVIDIIALIGATLTLPGIAGVVLSIGMAVDANIIIFERMKEELMWGKSLAAAVEAGFNRAWTAILDGNVTTLIAAAVLWVMGSSSIKGFALTLGLGVIASMFTAITVTRFMLRSLMTIRSLKNHKLFS